MFSSIKADLAAVLEKEGAQDAVAEFRELIGKTNPELAAEGTIRKKFAASKTRNAIHASDSDENAAWEASFFFTDKEIIDTKYELPLPEDEIDSD